VNEITKTVRAKENETEPRHTCESEPIAPNAWTNDTQTRTKNVNQWHKKRQTKTWT